MVGVMAFAQISPKGLRQQGAGHGGSPRTIKGLQKAGGGRLTGPVSARAPEGLAAQRVRVQVALLRYHASMPTPPNERRLLEQERAELPEQIIAHQTELFA